MDSMNDIGSFSEAGGNKARPSWAENMKTKFTGVLFQSLYGKNAQNSKGAHSKTPRELLFDFFYQHRSTARMYLRMRIAFDLISCILYVVERIHLNSDECCFIGRPYPIYILQTIISWTHCFDLALRFYLTRQTMRIFDVDLIMWIDFILGVPFLIGMFWMRIQNLWVPTFLRSWTALSTFHTVLFQKDMKDRKHSYFTDELYFLIATLACLIFTGACGINYVETVSSPADPIDIYNSFWFIVVTFATVGYGDVVPTSWEAKLFVMFLIALIIIVLPSQLEQLSSVYSQRYSNGGTYASTASRHVVLTSYSLSYPTVKDCLLELYGGDHGYDDLDVVLLERCEKQQHQLFLLLTMPMWERRLFYMKGSVLSTDDLERCRMSSACACFILPNKSAKSMEDADNETVVSAWAVKIHSPNTKIFVIFCLPENRYKLSFADHSVCIQDLEYAFLAKNTLCPAASTLITNTLHTTDEIFSFDSIWENEYGYGTGNEIYASQVGNSRLFRNHEIIGKPFTLVAAFIYKHYGAMPFAILRAATNQLFVNPGPEYLVAINDSIFYLSLVGEAEMGLDEPPHEHQFQHTGRSFPENDPALYDFNMSFNLDSNIDNHSYVEKHLHTSLEIELKGSSHSLAEVFAPLHANPASASLKPPSHPNLRCKTPRSSLHQGFEALRAQTLHERGLLVDTPYFVPYFGAAVARCYLQTASVEKGEDEAIQDLLKMAQFQGIWPDRPHIIVVAREATNSLFHLISYLRAEHIPMDEIHPLVLFLERQPNDTFIESIVYFPDVTYFVGSINSTIDFLKCGVMHCSKVVVCSLGEEFGHSEHEYNDYLWDVTTLMIVYKLQVEFPHVYALTSLYHRRNLRLMKFFPGKKVVADASAFPPATSHHKDYKLTLKESLEKKASMSCPSTPPSRQPPPQLQPQPQFQISYEKDSKLIHEPISFHPPPESSSAPHRRFTVESAPFSPTTKAETSPKQRETYAGPSAHKESFKAAENQEDCGRRDYRKLLQSENRRTLFLDMPDGEQAVPVQHSADVPADPPQTCAHVKENARNSWRPSIPPCENIPLQAAATESSAKGKTLPPANPPITPFDYKRELRRQSTARNGFQVPPVNAPLSRGFPASVVKESAESEDAHHHSAPTSFLRTFDGSFLQAGMSSVSNYFRSSKNHSMIDDHQTGLAYAFKPSYVSGLAFSLSFTESLLFQSFYKPNIIRLIRLLFHCSESPHSGILHLFPLTKRFFATFPLVKTYGQLVDFLILHLKLIPLGLYRTRTFISNQSTSQRKSTLFIPKKKFHKHTDTFRNESSSIPHSFPASEDMDSLSDDASIVKYPFSNPPPYVLLKSDDAVYVVGKPRNYDLVLYGTSTSATTL